MGRLNKPAQEGYRYRSPNQTNARDITPNLREDVAASQSADNERIRRGLNTAGTRPQNRAQVQNAAARAVTRSIGRAGLASLAGEAGYALGRKLDEDGIPFTGGVGKGIGKKLVDKSGLGKAAEKAVNRRDKVELSKSSKERLDEMEVDEALREVDREIKTSKYAEKDKPSEYRGDDEFKHGGRVKKMASGGMTVSKRADGIASRGKTKCKMY
jgi:hypothetical protein